MLFFIKETNTQKHSETLRNTQKHTKTHKNTQKHQHNHTCRLGLRYNSQLEIWEEMLDGTIVTYALESLFSKIQHAIILQVNILKSILLKSALIEFGNHLEDKEIENLEKLLIDKDSEINTVQHFDGLKMVLPNENFIFNDISGIFLLDLKVISDVKSYMDLKNQSYPPNVSLLYGTIGKEEEIKALVKELQKQKDPAVCPLIVLKSTPSKPAFHMLLVGSADFRKYVSEATSQISADELSFGLTEISQSIIKAINVSGNAKKMIGSPKDLLLGGRDPVPTVGFIAAAEPLTMPYSLFVM